MIKKRQSILFIFLLSFLLPCYRSLGDDPVIKASPTPPSVKTVGKGSRKTTPQVSSVFKKEKPKHRVVTGFGLDAMPTDNGFLMDTGYYNRLNADLYPALNLKKEKLSEEEKFWGTVAGAASYGCAGIAAAQALGVLSDGKTTKKK